ncbi:Alpha-ketoglutarate-dependent dioxygenase alkB homolog 6 [Strongyloides ratti]|uniref:Alpha-ketoglutarate-dependent dioxygenase alkB homolog 6 n=1 Tax=Strongyloides ratti TaxID=34506 RepID=A0A090L084_STRRB|nr:Alpha-ketoglutarate-dependent dioxygenase alkB homolog 6 [Strongyloides ratti]CEF63091.1 Alpha-ketoglutarate-dependent dioxygenase alkB homolog 6 [Strongyloides ratti]
MDSNKYLIKNCPETIRYIPNFISIEEEEYMLHLINNAPLPKWDCLSNRRLQVYGGIINKKKILIPDEGIPQGLDYIIEKIVSVEDGFKLDKRPNHLLVNEYLPGQGIMPHTDGDAYHPLVATISLGSPILLDFYKTLNRECVASFNERYIGSMFLEPRSLVLLSNDIYSNYLHSIAEREEDVITENIFNLDQITLKIGDVVKRKTRVSLTYRHVDKVSKLNVMNLLKK